MDGQNNETSIRCNLCEESLLKVGQKTEYGSVIVSRIGDSLDNGWFATLSPKTGGDPEKDFTIQLMPFAHLTHFHEIANFPELAKNYGLIFSKVNKAMFRIMSEEQSEFKDPSETRELAVSIATYGKATTWKEKKEHLHIKIFPFRGAIGQPHTVDSSFGRKDIFADPDTNKKFVRMMPVSKKFLNQERIDFLVKRLIPYL